MKTTASHDEKSTVDGQINVVLIYIYVRVLVVFLCTISTYWNYMILFVFNCILSFLLHTSWMIPSRLKCTILSSTNERGVVLFYYIINNIRKNKKQQQS